MAGALICSPQDLQPELGRTVLWRTGIERHVARRLEDALTMAVAARPHIVVVDRDLPRADELIAALREDPGTRRVSIAVVARGDLDPAELGLLQAGANAILRLPPGPDWDERLVRLLDVPARRETRLPVEFGVDALGTGVGERLPAQAVNLSRSGILIETMFDLGVGDEVELEFSLEGEGVLARGRVVRRGEPRLFGVQFAPLPEYAAVTIQRFVGSPEA
ncbi:MAG TPA: PilZ domain-containing protein [Vicinamibacteria bacterium]|jgi:CheY-like chemotaxis protein